MNNSPEPRDDVVQKEQSALRALDAYRERRRRRRGDDTFFGSTDCLVQGIDEGVGDQERERRRSEIMGDAEEFGMPRDLAELLYDVAQDEGIDPGLAYELVRTGLGVVPPDDGVTNASTVPSSDKYFPTWMFPAEPPDELLRERMLRVSFRRLRSLLEEYPAVDEAFRKFANEPDVGHFGY
ncbi:MAG TPA: hypothetical protein VFI91_12610 [Longimicrobiaceae bacterium]|nr:hypothetical protein [Longimicrobiaceae bacterium]